MLNEKLLKSGVYGEGTKANDEGPDFPDVAGSPRAMDRED